jgi:hypothetical protein
MNEKDEVVGKIHVRQIVQDAELQKAEQRKLASH